MKQILTERNLVVVLFVLVLITFSLAQEDTKKMERLYSGATTQSAENFLVKHSTSTSDNIGSPNRE